MLLICGTLFLLSFGGVISCSKETSGLANISMTPPMGHISRVEGYNSIDDIIRDSPVIVTGIVYSKNNVHMDGEMPFALTQFKVETAIRGEVSKVINIFQTYAYEDPYLVEGDKMVLFLTPYSGRVTQSAYRLKGLFQGQYKVVDGKIIKKTENYITGDALLENVEAFKLRVSHIGYSPSIMSTSVPIPK
jgi:hypothetical protein